MGAQYWPSILLFLTAGFIALFCNYRRRKQKREVEEFREREIIRRQRQEQLQHRQFLLNFPNVVSGAEQLRRGTKEQRAQDLLVPGVSSCLSVIVVCTYVYWCVAKEIRQKTISPCYVKSLSHHFFSTNRLYCKRLQTI
jgi:hypothetical protein